MLYVLGTTDWMLQAERAKELTQTTSSPSNSTKLPITAKNKDNGNHNKDAAQSLTGAAMKKINLEEILCINEKFGVGSTPSEAEPLITPSANWYVDIPNYVR